MIGGAQQNSPAHEILVLKAVEGQLLNNVYIVGENGASLGRHSASNDIVISESFVSRRHCEIKYMPNSSEVDQNTVMSGPQNTDSNLSKFHMRDIGSTTGTFIMVRNEVLLKQNMMFQMGLSEFKVVLTSKKDMIELHVFEGPSRNKIVPVDSYGLGIGRDQAFISLIQQQEGCVNDPELVAQQILGNVNKANSFCVQDDSQMSNYHARITFYKAGDGRQEGFYLQDVGSTNRTWLRLSSEGEQSSLHPLRINDILKIGSTVFVVQTNDPQNFKNMPVINRRLAVQNMYMNSALNEEEKSNNNGNQMIIDKGPSIPNNQDVLMQQNQLLQNQQLPNSLFRNSSPRGGQNQNLTYINTALDSAMGIPSQNQNPYNQISSTNNAQISNSSGQASSQDSTCKICYEQDGNAAFIPCGHNFACVECAQKCTRCPVCREPFDDIIKIPKDLIKCF